MPAKRRATRKIKEVLRRKYEGKRHPELSITHIFSMHIGELQIFPASVPRS